MASAPSPHFTVIMPESQDKTVPGKTDSLQEVLHGSESIIFRIFLL